MTRINCRTTPTIRPGLRYVHPDAVDTGGCAEGCCDRFVCPHCGTRFTMETAQ